MPRKAILSSVIKRRDIFQKYIDVNPKVFNKKVKTCAIENQKTKFHKTKIKDTAKTYFC